MSESTPRSILSPIAGAAARRAELLQTFPGAVDIFDHIRPAAPEFAAALDITGDIIVGTGSITFDARLAGALGAAHFLVSADKEDGIAVQQALGQLVRIDRVPAGLYVIDEPERTGSAVECEGQAVRRVDVASIRDAQTQEPIIGPELFERNLLKQAREKKAHIVMPECDDDRILQAADQLLAEKVCELTIMGDPDAIAARSKELELDLSGANLVDPTGGDQLEQFAKDFAELRKAKGVTLEQARETMQDISYYATMMVHQGLADGMVSGAAHTTAHTIKPSFQIIKTAPGSSVVSSIFLMVMDGVLWAFGDCAVNPNPTPDQLAEIAAVSAKTAAQFGIEPRVALLSYSTGTPGSGEDVEAVAAAVEKAKQDNPDLELDGPLQFDAAVVESVGQKKMPGSDVAGRATVFVFPDLNSGNIAYKAVQRTADALAVGPILQGLNKPVNDLSRGATVPDIVNTVAITAIQS